MGFRILYSTAYEVRHLCEVGITGRYLATRDARASGGIIEYAASSPEKVKMLFMGRRANGDDSYVKAGWKIRKVRIVDLGDPESNEGEKA